MTSPTPAENPRAQLDQHMGTRRADLRLKWKDVAERAGLTTEGLRGIRFGTGEIRPLTKRGIEDALQWAPGSIDTILDGGDPTPAPSPAEARFEERSIGTRREPPPEEQVHDETDPRLERAYELLAEAQQLLAEMQQDRQKGA